MQPDVLIALGLALPASFLSTPVTCRLARRWNLVDHPTDWKTHPVPTPCLGGFAVLAGITAGSFVEPNTRTEWLLITAWLLSLVGFVDDRVRLDVRLRLICELLAAIFLWQLNLGWQIAGSQWLDLLVTAAWVLGVMNAFNILDLMDGVAGSVIASSAAAVALLGLMHNDVATAALGFATAGACAGFLPFNLAKPARTFLGDGGTMPLGFLASALIPLALHGATENPLAPAVGLLFFGVPLIDAAWRALRRLRRRVSLMTAGHDSLADDLCRRLGTTHRVSLYFAGAQTVCSSFALAISEFDRWGQRIAPALMLVGVVAIFVASAKPQRRMHTLPTS
jgi:UDP-GlcNAc:undecaprenyl-phosphate GlcNAc-1-phosphate transferase